MPTSNACTLSGDDRLYMFAEVLIQEGLHVRARRIVYVDAHSEHTMGLRLLAEMSAAAIIALPPSERIDLNKSASLVPR